MKTSEIDQLGSLSLFAHVPRGTLETLCRGGLLQSYPEGTQIIRQGEKPDFLYVLLEGSVEMIGTGADNRDTVVEILKPVDCFILAAVLTDSPHLMSARVVEPARLLLIPAGSLRGEIASDHNLALNMLASLSSQFRRMVRQVKNLKLRTATQRLGCYLVTRADDEGAERFQLETDKRRLAAHLGMTPESLSRAFATLREYGVEASGRWVELTDPDALRQFCTTDDLIDSIETELTIPGPTQIS